MNGTVEEVAARDAIPLEHCAAVGREAATIERTVSFPIVVRDDPSEAQRAFRALCDANGMPDAGNVPTLLGPPSSSPPRSALRRPRVPPDHRAAARPYDAETIARIGEVRTALAG